MNFQAIAIVAYFAHIGTRVPVAVNFMLSGSKTKNCLFHFLLEHGREETLPGNVLIQK